MKNDYRCVDDYGKQSGEWNNQITVRQIHGESQEQWEQRVEKETGIAIDRAWESCGIYVATLDEKYRRLVFGL